MIFDPHNMVYGGLNLHPEHWCELQKHERLLALVEKVKEIFEQELVAVVNNSVLDEIAFESTFNIELNSELVNMGWYDGHYAGIALCILTHGAMEHFNEKDQFPWQCHYEQTGKTRFSKSPHDNLAYLPENVNRVLVPGKSRWFCNQLKNKPVIIPVVEPPQQFSLFG